MKHSSSVEKKYTALYNASNAAARRAKKEPTGMNKRAARNARRRFWYFYHKAT